MLSFKLNRHSLSPTLIIFSLSSLSYGPSLLPVCSSLHPILYIVKSSNYSTSYFPQSQFSLWFPVQLFSLSTLTSCFFFVSLFYIKKSLPFLLYYGFLLLCLHFHVFIHCGDAFSSSSCKLMWTICFFLYVSELLYFYHFLMKMKPANIKIIRSNNGTKNFNFNNILLHV